MSVTPNRPGELRRRSPWDDIAPWSSRMRELMEDVWPALPASVDYAPGGRCETDESFTVEARPSRRGQEEHQHRHVRPPADRHGERVVKEREGVLRHTTRVTGSFSYEAVLPAPVDEKKVTAVLADGVLTITMPKATEAKTTHITVK